jgi:hypothetical protein
MLYWRFTGTKVQILTQRTKGPSAPEEAGQVYALLALYWYKSTNTDAEARCSLGAQNVLDSVLLSLLALLVQKYTY